MSEIDNVIPGQAMNEAQRAALAVENAKVSEEAHAMAAEARQRDSASGLAEPSVTTVANAIKSKLEREEFQEGDIHGPK